MTLALLWHMGQCFLSPRRPMWAGSSTVRGQLLSMCPCGERQSSGPGGAEGSPVAPSRWERGALLDEPQKCRVCEKG